MGLCGGDRHLVRVGIPIDLPPRRAGFGGLSLCNHSWLRLHDAAGDTAAAPLFSPKQGKPLGLSALGGPFFAVGVYRFVYQSGPVRPPCYYLGRADRHTGQGAVLRRALPRCTRDAGIFKHPDHHSQLCGLCGGQLLPQIPRVLQSV